MICIFCETELKPVFPENDPDFRWQPYAGGEVSVRFDFGSQLDQLGYRHSEIDKDGPRYEQLLKTEKIVGYICDECFKKKQHLFSGFNAIRPEITWEKSV